MPWIVLLFAGLFEVVWSFAMKESHGFSRLGPSVIMVGAMIVSFALLAIAMKSLPLGTAYTVWTGIGALGAFALGVLVLGEPLGLTRVVAAALILSGMILMKIGSPG